MGWDTIIIGSGFGGSVTALRLAEANMRVLVLERGPWWGPRLEGDVDAERRAYPRGAGWRSGIRNIVWAKGQKTRRVELDARGLLEFHLHPKLFGWTASGVGGGSLIYTDILMRPPKDFWKALPAEMSEEELAPYFDKFVEMMRPAPLPESKRREDARPRQMLEASEKTGEEPFFPPLSIQFDDVPEGNAAGVHQPPCIHCGECFVGCPTGAKTTLDRTYLPAAIKAGADIWEMCEVEAIASHDHGYSVHYRDRRTGQRQVEQAPRVVMAAGTFNTLALLNDAHHRHRSVEVPPALGRQFSPNGDMMAAGWRSGPQDGPPGPNYPALLTTGTENGGPLIVWGEVGSPAAFFGDGPLREWLRSTYLYFAIGQDRMHASVRTGPDGIQVQASRLHRAPYYGRSERLMHRLMEGYELDRQVENLPGGRGSAHLTSVHPMGGASIGRGPDEGVVDHRGEVFGNPGLYVADGSLYPTEPGVPPSLTIAAMAERQAELMVSRTREELPAERVAIAMPQTRPSAIDRPRAEITVRPTDLRLLTPGALERTWQSAPPAEVPQVQGRLPGSVVHLRGVDPLPLAPRKLLDRLVGALSLWRGKHIVGARGHNHFGLGGAQVRFGQFEVRAGRAWQEANRQDAKQVLVLDYDQPENPAWLRRLRGELCRLEPDLFLGRVGWRGDGGVHFLMYFGLAAPTKRRRASARPKRASEIRPLTR
ncbi:GMC oxidoreductase [Persicimonas caeni]|uniref:GMC oxidoreductase n=1 Tax=Persicimonas caeni TaxID=2292766 RepID=UPI001C9B7984|nr:GMC oxidoreductase [Persicimonas caeni]